MHRLPTSWLRFVALLALVLGPCAGAAHADSLTLAWDPNPEPDVVGYVVYIGNAPGSYTQQVDVAGATQYVVTATPCACSAATRAGSLVRLPPHGR